MRRLWAWLTSPILTPDVIAVPSDSVLAERVDAAHLRLLSALDEQSQQWPEGRDQLLIDLASDVLLILGVDLAGGPGEVPVIPGRSQ